MSAIFNVEYRITRIYFIFTKLNEEEEASRRENVEKFSPAKKFNLPSEKDHRNPHTGPRDWITDKETTRDEFNGKNDRTGLAKTNLAARRNRLVSSFHYRPPIAQNNRPPLNTTNMNPDEKINRNQSQDDPPFDIDCSTETLTNEQKKQQKNNTWTSEVSDNTMLSAASGSLSGEHDDTGMLFDESELLGTSSQKESQDESDEMTNSDQESTLEAEDKTPSPLAKRNTSPDGAKETSPERAKETPTSPKGAKNRTSQTKAKKPKKDQAKSRKTESASAPTDRVTRNKPRLDYGSIHKGKNETPSTDHPTTSRDQQNTPDQQMQMNETRKLKTELKETKIKLERAEKDNNEKQNTIDNQLAKIIAQQDTIADLQTKIDNLEKQTTPN